MRQTLQRQNRIGPQGLLADSEDGGLDKLTTWTRLCVVKKWGTTWSFHSLASFCQHSVHHPGGTHDWRHDAPLVTIIFCDSVIQTKKKCVCIFIINTTILTPAALSEANRIGVFFFFFFVFSANTCPFVDWHRRLGCWVEETWKSVQHSTGRFWDCGVNNRNSGCQCFQN